MNGRWSPRFTPNDLARSVPALRGGADAGPVPLFRRIARLFTDEIRRGRLRAGDRLPATRALARMLEVNRNTVVTAYDELVSEGWVATTPASGTFVSQRLPDLSPRRFAAASALRAGVPEGLGFDLGPAQRGIPDPPPPVLPKGGLFLWGGMPDLTLVPAAALARAYRRAVRDRAAVTLTYTGDARGDPRLRAAIATMISATRGLSAGAEDVVVTRGSQMALDLIARALVRRGDVIAVEELGYRRAWDAFHRAGATLVPIPIDGDGLDVGALETLVARRRVRALYLTPHHQYPSTVVLSAARRIALLDLARRARLAIIEDDYDHEFHFEGHPVMPLGSADRAGVVIYVGTFAKILAPGLRLGFTVAPRPLLDRIATLRAVVDRQGDMASESAVADLIEDGELQRHARRMRRIYQSRRDVFVAALRRRLGDALTFDVPPGGMSLWARAATGIDAEAWCRRAAVHGVGFITGGAYALPGDAHATARWRDHLRLGYSFHDAPQLEEAVRRMEVALRRTKTPGKPKAARMAPRSS
jgi:GntR family transcriptional regulator/MocR family aminotransferase